jgi:hypothetical protein
VESLNLKFKEVGSKIYLLAEARKILTTNGFKEFVYKLGENMKMLLIGLLVLGSIPGFSMDLENFAKTCPKQMKQFEAIGQRAEDHYNNWPNATELKFAEGSVVLASVVGFISKAEECSDVDHRIPEILIVMKKLGIK